MVLLRYEKKGSAIYLSHLDILRHFNMALRRCGVKVAISCGFNPRPLLYFSPPIPIGIESEAEFVTIATNEESLSVMEKLNSSLPNGLKILSSEKVEKNPNLAANIKEAKYKIEFEKDALKGFCEKEFLKKTEFIIRLKQRGVEVNREVRQRVLSLEKQGDTLFATLACGNLSLNPLHFVSNLGVGDAILIRKVL